MPVRCYRLWHVIKPDCLNIEHITKEVFVIAALFMRDYNMYRKKSKIFSQFHITFLIFLDKGMLLTRNIVCAGVAPQPFSLQYIVYYLIAFQYVF